MPSKQTQNYQLSQWEPEDKVVHGDFNEDNRKIDEAIKAVADQANGLAVSKADASIVTAIQSVLSALQTSVEGKQDASGAVQLAVGRYIGTTTPTATGTVSGSQTISLSFKPKAVLVIMEDGRTFDSVGAGSVRGGLAVTDYPGMFNNHATVEITGSGFRVYTYWASGDNHYIRLNNKDEIYHYIALG